MARTEKTRRGKPPALSNPVDTEGVTGGVDKPVFAQPEPTDDPKRFEVKHPSDGPVYKQIDALNKEHKINPLPFPRLATCPSRRSASPRFSAATPMLWRQS